MRVAPRTAKLCQLTFDVFTIMHISPWTTWKCRVGIALRAIEISTRILHNGEPRRESQTDCFVIRRPNSMCWLVNFAIERVLYIIKLNNETVKLFCLLNSVFQSGIITKSRDVCHTPCQNPLSPQPGECCPSCKGESTPAFSHKRSIWTIWIVYN